MNNNEKLKIYKELFSTYLNFHPNYRRSLIDLEDMYKWLKELDFRNSIREYSDLRIFMEWLSTVNLLKPLYVLEVPKPPEGTLFTIRIDEIEKDYKEGLILFPENVYNVRKSIQDINKSKMWDYSKHEIPREDIATDYKTYIEAVKYLYHPLQFFNLLTFIKGNIYSSLLDTKVYKEFYWKRKFLLDDHFKEVWEDHIKKNDDSIEDFIEKEIKSGGSFHQFLGIMLGQNKWITPERLELWIMIESIFLPHFFKPSNIPNISMNIQLPYFQKWDQEKRKEKVEEINKWLKYVNKNFKTFFGKEDFHKIQEFRQSLEIYLRLDGLEDFIDLFLLIKPEKKDKLKGNISLFVNIIEIIRVLKLIEHRLIKEYSELEEFKSDLKWYEPRFNFDTEGEYIEYTKKVLLKYDLFQEDKFILFVEGKTESILLEEWLSLVYNRTGVKITLKTLGGKRNDVIFEYLIKNFKLHDFFLVLDADKPDYIKGKKDCLKGKGIDEDSYYIFFPDFITENFSIQEVLKAFKNYIFEINNEIELEGKRIKITNSEYSKLEEELKSKKDLGYESVIEGFMKNLTKNDTIELKKVKFAEHLRNEMRENFSIVKGREQYPFEKIVGKFIEKIQMRQFPKDLKKKR